MAYREKLKYLALKQELKDSFLPERNVGRGGTSAREISFVSFVAYGPNSDSALTMGVTAFETRQGGSQ